MTQVLLSMCELQDKGKGPYIEISTLLSEYLVIQVQEGIKSNVQIVLHALAIGSVVECLTRDRRVAGLSLTGVTALCP